MHRDNYNYLKYIYNTLIIQSVLLCVLLSPVTSFGQDQQEIQIANEYLMKGQKDKAIALYTELAKKNENVPSIHANYFNLMLDLGQFKAAEEYVERLIRRDGKLTYRLDLGVLYVRSGELAKADKHLRGIIKAQADDPYKLKSVADILAARNLTEYAIVALQEARGANPNLFTLELANLYRMAGKRDQMVEEYLNYVTQTPANIAYVKNLMQILLTKPEELESLEKLLYDRVQKNQNSEVYIDLLIWVNLQQKNFYGAFVQARAYDKRFKREQSKTMEIAQIALNNQDYVNADKAFSYVIKEFANTENELPARLGLIRTREAKVKQSFPVNRDSVRYLIAEYKKFIDANPNQPNSLEATVNEALLHAYYLDEKDSAVNTLTRLIANNKTSPSLKSKAKIDLGDIYLLKEEPWEATLLYSQVEKSQRETPIGSEAKLKNAKLSYFRGNFQLAQEHLDILKQATTREIANDAMELSMRIKENITFDSTGAALKEYASIELLLAQNKNDEALLRLQNFKAEQSITIKDDVYWLEANVRLKRGEFAQAVALLEKIVVEYGEDILSDDAYFLQGEIYERYLKNKDKAMEIYREFLNKYPGSVFAAEARKRYRTMRGDFENQPNQ